MSRAGIRFAGPAPGSCPQDGRRGLLARRAGTGGRRGRPHPRCGARGHRVPVDHSGEAAISAHEVVGGEVIVTNYLDGIRCRRPAVASAHGSMHSSKRWPPHCKRPGELSSMLVRLWAFFILAASVISVLHRTGRACAEERELVGQQQGRGTWCRPPGLAAQRVDCLVHGAASAGPRVSPRCDCLTDPSE